MKCQNCFLRENKKISTICPAELALQCVEKINMLARNDVVCFLFCTCRLQRFLLILKEMSVVNFHLLYVLFP